jgi:ubiquinone/menaquinone biosynthesis C-methylase UbiE
VSSSYRLADYLFAMEGLSILRLWGTDPQRVSARAGDVVRIVSAIEEPPYSDLASVPEYDVPEGYDAWAGSYDSMDNILFPIEERVVHPLLGALPPGRALDAACGTGRYAAWLATQGHEVIGIDASEAMLAFARRKAPSARFETASLEDLPLADGSVNLVACALALTHLQSLEIAMLELARVLAPGGRLVLSDVHPFCTALGLHAFFRTESGDRGCIQNRHHPISSYVRAFSASGLEIVRCIEVPFDYRALSAQPVYNLIPEAIETALSGLPLLLIWELTRP